MSVNNLKTQQNTIPVHILYSFRKVECIKYTVSHEVMLLMTFCKIKIKRLNKLIYVM